RADVRFLRGRAPEHGRGDGPVGDHDAARGAGGTPGRAVPQPPPQRGRLGPSGGPGGPPRPPPPSPPPAALFSPLPPPPGGAPRPLRLGRPPAPVLRRRSSRPRAGLPGSDCRG